MRTTSSTGSGRRIGRLWLAVFACWVAVVGAPSPSAALGSEDEPAATVHVVYPTGVFPDDVVRVQAAVDAAGAGDTVLLKATNAAGAPTAFDFGPASTGGRVFLEHDVEKEIVGERTAAAVATVRGGRIPFLGNTTSRLAIRGLHFDRPGSSAVIVIRSTGVEIVGNSISGVVGNFVTPTLTEGRIKFLGGLDPNGAITGRIVVRDNVIEDLDADFADATRVDAVAGDVEITGNRIENVGPNGILVRNNRGSVEIADNEIRPGAGNSGPLAQGKGIGIAALFRGAPYTVVRNRIYAENPKAGGIFLFARSPVTEPRIEYNHVVMTNNHVVMTNSFTAIDLLGNVSGAVVAYNRLEGTAAFGFDLVALSPFDLAASNTFVGNNVSRLTATQAHLFLDAHTHNTVFVGNGGTVVDLGTGNHVTGLTPMGGAAIGRQIREAAISSGFAPEDEEAIKRG